MKRITAYILAMVIIAAFIPIRTLAVSGKDELAAAACAGGFSFEFVNDADIPWQVTSADERSCISSDCAEQGNISTVALTCAMQENTVILFDYAMKMTGSSDIFTFSVKHGDDVEEKQFSGSSDWKQYSYLADSDDTYTFTWSYYKNSNATPSENCAMLDNIWISDNLGLIDITPSRSGAVINVGETDRLEFSPVPCYAPMTELSIKDCDESIVHAEVVGNFVELTGVAQGRTFVTVAADCGVERSIYVSVTDDFVAGGYLSYSPGSASGFSDYNFTNDTISLLSADTTAYYAGEYYNGKVYAWDGATRNIFCIDTRTWERTTLFTATNIGIMRDMAYDYSTDTMYYISLDTDPEKVYLHTLNLTTGKIGMVGEVTGMGETPLTLACSTDGTLYSVEVTDGGFYSINKDTAEATFIGQTGFTPQFIQSSAYDHRTGKLYWAMCNLTSGSMLEAALCSIDLTTGEADTLSDAAGQISCFYFEYYEASDTATGIYLSSNSAEMYAGEEMTLTAAVTPSTNEDGLYYVSSNEAVIAVDGNGCVTALSEGLATVTAISSSGSYSDICDITVYPNREKVVIFDEDFEDEPTGWSLYDADGDGATWTRKEQQENAFGGNGYIESTSYDYYTYEGVSADNWISSPSFRVCEGTKISWQVKELRSDWLDSYEVYISIDGQNNKLDISDFGIKIFEGVPTQDGMWSEVTVDISEYVGEDAVFSIRHIDSGEDAILVDDICVWYYANIVHTVTFCDNDGTAICEKRVGDGQTVHAPTPPTHSGYVFLQWNGELTNVTADITLNAVYGIIGDANLDNVVNTGDAVAVLRHVVGLNILSENMQITADIVNDGIINTGDAVGILKKCVGLD